LIVDDRDLPANQTIEQRGFADIGPSNNRNTWRLAFAVHDIGKVD
jgi:hypothetical protein